MDLLDILRLITELSIHHNALYLSSPHPLPSSNYRQHTSNQLSLTFSFITRHHHHSSLLVAQIADAEKQLHTYCELKSTVFRRQNTDRLARSALDMSKVMRTPLAVLCLLCTLNLTPLVLYTITTLVIKIMTPFPRFTTRTCLSTDYPFSITHAYPSYPPTHSPISRIPLLGYHCYRRLVRR